MRRARSQRRGRSGGVATFGASVLSLASGSVLASPTGGQVTAGNGQITQNGTQTTITQQSQNLAIDWQSFNIGANQGVTFNQPGAAAIVLNEVVGQSPTQILGSLKANGQVFILNPNGVLFGSSAQVSVGGIVAGTLSLNLGDFLDGKYDFFGTSTASVSNTGTITAANGGYIALLGAQVSNSGRLLAPLGNASLAAGQQVTLQLDNGSLLGLTVNQGALNALASNQGLIRANGGRVLLTAEAADALTKAVVNNGGIIEAQSLDGHDGTIQLLGDMGSGTVNVSGTLDASNTVGGAGGEIEVFGSAINLLGDATLRANGISGGGTIHVGGDFHGAVAAENATSTYVADTASIEANAGKTGDGGRISVWSNEQTYMYGSISASGGAAGGNGGFVETSSKNYLDFRGTVDLLAPRGTTGTLLLDPYAITIDDTAGTNGTPITGVGTNPETFTSGTASDVSSTTINDALQTTNVLIQTGAATSGSSVVGSIVVATNSTNLSWTTTNTLSLAASGNITINSPITGTNGTLELVSSGAGTISQAAGATIAVHSLVASSTGGTVALATNANAIQSVAGTAGAGGFALDSIDSLTVTTVDGVVNAATTGISSPGGQVTLTSSGSINTAAATISGTGLTLQASTGIGTQATPLATAVQTLTATNNSGADIAISNTASALTLDSIDPAGNGNVYIKNSGSLTAVGPIVDPNDLVLSAGTALAVSGSITAIGTVDLEAGTGNISQGTATGDTISAPQLAANAPHGSVSLINDNNAVGTIAGTAATGFTFEDNPSMALAPIAALGTGAITGSGGSGVHTTGAGNIALETSGNFDNTIGSAALSVAAGHRWLVYSTNPADDNDNGLTENFQQYNVAFAQTLATPADTTATDNGFLYSLAPTLTVTLQGVLEKTYNASTTATPAQSNYDITGQLNGDTVTLSDTSANYATRNVGTNEAVTVNGLSVASASNGSIKVYGYRVASGSSTVTGNIGEILAAPLTITPNTATKTYDGTTSVASGGSVNGSGLQGTDSVTGTESFISKNVMGTNGSTLTVDGFTVNDGNNGNNYDITVVTNTGTIRPATLTLSAGTDTKVYDTTTSAAGSVVGYSGLANGDTLSGLTESFTSPNVLGTNGSTLTVNGGYVINDGNNGHNYTVVTQNAAGTITPAALTLTTVSDSKVYDGTSAAPGTTVGVNGLLGSDTISNDVEAFASKNVEGTNGSTLTVAPGYTINDGNGGRNYTVTIDTSTGTITPATLTLDAVTDTRTYDATTGATGTTVGIVGLQGSDTVTGLTESFGSRNVMGANGSTLSVNSGYTINDGNGGNNYVVTTNTATGTITPATLTLSAITDSKTYDGTTSATGTTVGISGLLGSDTVSGLTESFGSKNVMGANGSTLSVNSGYVINDGNGGNNYTVTTDTATGTISPAPLTITANSASKPAYTANPAFSATYTGLVTGDTPASLSGTLDYSTTATTRSPQGNYAIVPSGVSSSNYTIDFVDGILTIVPGTLSVATQPDGAYDSALAPADGLLSGSTPPSAQPAGPWLTVKGTGIMLPAGVSEVE